MFLQSISYPTEDIKFFVIRPFDHFCHIFVFLVTFCYNYHRIDEYIVHLVMNLCLLLLLFFNHL